MSCVYFKLFFHSKRFELSVWIVLYKYSCLALPWPWKGWIHIFCDDLLDIPLQTFPIIYNPAHIVSIHYALEWVNTLITWNITLIIHGLDSLSGNFHMEEYVHRRFLLVCELQFCSASITQLYSKDYKKSYSNIHGWPSIPTPHLALSIFLFCSGNESRCQMKPLSRAVLK